MSNLAKNESYVPRQDLQRTLTYRPHLKWGYYLFTTYAIGLAVYENLSVVGQFWRGESPGDFDYIVWAWVVPVLMLLEAWFVLRPFAFSKVIVKPDGLTLDQLGRQTELPYSSIKLVKLVFIPYLGGHFKILTEDGKSQKFTVVLERSEYILESLSAYNAKLFSPDAMALYRRTAVVSDHSWGRYYESLKNWKSLALKFVALPVLAAGVSSLFDGMAYLNHLWSLVFINLVVAFTVWTMIAIVMMSNDRSRLMADPQNLRRDMAFEAKVSRIGTMVHYMVFVAAAILITTV
jgi:hypothetical protein